MMAQLGLLIFLFNSTWKYRLKAYVLGTKLIAADVMMVFIHKKSIIHWRLTGGRDDYEANIQQCFSRCGPRTSSIGITWDLIRNATSILNQQSILIILPDDFDGSPNLRTMFLYKGKKKVGHTVQRETSGEQRTKFWQMR